jgi:integrase
VRRKLADGTVKEYRYEKHAFAEARIKPAIADLSDRYQKSTEFGKLSPAWQNASCYYLNILEAELGWMTYADLKDRRCRGDFFDLRDKYRDRPYMADKTMAVLRRLLEWGYDRGLIEVNHAMRIPKLVESNRPRAEIVWTEEQCGEFLAAAREDMAQAFTIALYTGLRASDVINLQWVQFDGQWLKVTTRKTGAVVYLPVYALPVLADTVASLSRCTNYMLNMEWGHPWGLESLKKHFQKTMVRAGLSTEDLHWHDLRGTLVTRLFDAGATEAEVAAITGHVIGRDNMLGAYAKRTRELALNAYKKLARYMAGESNVVQLKVAANG